MNILLQLIFLLLFRIKGVFVSAVNSERVYDKVVAQLGSPLTLRCQINCTAWIRASWHLEKAMEPICTSCFQEIKRTERSHNMCTELLTIRYKSLYQTRYKYICNSVKSDDPRLTQKIERQVLVVVQAPPSAPVVKVTPQRDVRAGRPTGLTCATERFYPRDLKVTWAFNGSTLGTNKLTMRTNSDGTFSAQSEISVIPTASYHGGVFTCEIHHSTLDHPLSANITLDVKYLSLHISYSDSTESTVEALPPPYTIRASLGAFLKLSCLVDSNPPTEGQWARESAATSRQAIGSATTLTLAKIKEEDAGNYSCVASTGYENKHLIVTIDVNSGESSWFKVLAATMVIVASVLGAAAVYFSLSSRRKKHDRAFTSCNSSTANSELRVDKPPATGESAVKWEPVAVTFTGADSQSDHEVPYADIMISVRGSSTPELTHIPEPTPREHRPRWKEEGGSSSRVQVFYSADRLHVQERDVARKLSTSSEYAVIQYRSEPLI